MPSFEKPLAELLRPTKLADFFGQEDLVGKDSPIRKSLKNGDIYSMIFWGPPGCGKTTLARLLANKIHANFIEISPTTAGVKDIKSAVDSAKTQFFGQKKKTILFIDEIHRFNKAQQDYLLPHVEDGTITLIGATTENPSFEVISPLLSRTRVYVFKPLSVKEIKKVLKKAHRYIVSCKVKLDLSKDAFDFIAQISNGDARTAINAIESIALVGTNPPSLEEIHRILQENPNRYDKKGDEHYNTISAYIKSMRASDVNAALYYLARMVNSGEDPLFIARRMVIFASEDIGMANTNAILVANEVFKACETIGYPECQLNLAHGTIYMAKSNKSRKVPDSFFEALKDVKEEGNLSIPLNIRNAPTKLMKDLGYGKNYEIYPKNTSFLPKKLADRRYFK